ncbi:MAG: diacylglycerol kinase family lipid kinase [Mucinivorans sp.]
MISDLKLENRWFAIVNPVSGKGRGLADWPQISTLLDQAGVAFDALFTLYKFHATELVVRAIKRGYRRIIIMGGDGTVHEAINGLFIQQEIPSSQITLSVIAVGTGNDWIRMFGISRNYTQAIRAITDGVTFLQDVGRVTYFESQVQQTRYMANVGGVAYDANVCRSFNRLKERGYRGSWLYIRAALTNLIRYRCRSTTIVADGQTIFRGKLFTASIAIGKYSGGGLSQTPLAIPDDGLFDMTIIPRMNRWRLFFRFGAFYNDNIYNISHIELHRAANISIHSMPVTHMELDGESLGTSDFSFSILPQAIRVIVSRSYVSPSVV